MVVVIWFSANIFWSTCYLQTSCWFSLRNVTDVHLKIQPSVTLVIWASQRFSVVGADICLPASEAVVLTSCQGATSSLCSLRATRQQLRREGGELIDFFCEDGDTFRLDDCFSTFRSFCSKFRDAVKVRANTNLSTRPPLNTRKANVSNDRSWKVFQFSSLRGCLMSCIQAVFRERLF